MVGRGLVLQTQTLKHIKALWHKAAYLGMLTPFWHTAIGREGPGSSAITNITEVRRTERKIHLLEDIYLSFITYSSLQSEASLSATGVIVEIKTGLIVFTVLLKNK